MFQQTFEGWRTVYLIAAGVATAGATVFLVLGDTSIQEWNYPDRKRPAKSKSGISPMSEGVFNIRIDHKTVTEL